MWRHLAPIALPPSLHPSLLYLPSLFGGSRECGHARGERLERGLVTAEEEAVSLVL